MNTRTIHFVYNTMLTRTQVKLIVSALLSKAIQNLMRLDLNCFIKKVSKSIIYQYLSLSLLTKYSFSFLLLHVSANGLTNRVESNENCLTFLNNMMKNKCVQNVHMLQIIESQSVRKLWSI